MNSPLIGFVIKITNIIQWEWIREKKLLRSTTIYHPGKVDEKNSRTIHENVIASDHSRHFDVFVGT
jgi:hypothetical protein